MPTTALPSTTTLTATMVSVHCADYSFPGQFMEKFKDITQAYQVIGEEDKRKRYDALRKGGPDPSAFGKGGFGGFQGQKPNFDQEKLRKDFEKLWKQFTQSSA